MFTKKKIGIILNKEVNMNNKDLLAQLNKPKGDPMKPVIIVLVCLVLAYFGSNVATSILNDNQATACVVGYKQGIQEGIYVGSQGLIQVDLNHPEVDSKLRVNCEQILKSK